MNIRIQFSSSTIKTLVEALHKAYEQDSLPMVKRISALLAVARGDPVDQVGEMLKVSRATLYNWLKEFMLKGINSFKHRFSRGRKSTFTAPLTLSGHVVIILCESKCFEPRRGSWAHVSERIVSIHDDRAVFLQATGGLLIEGPQRNVDRAFDMFAFELRRRQHLN